MARRLTTHLNTPDEDLAEQLHWSAIRLLRRARVPDSKTGLSQARLSALSVLVFDGETTMGELARVERIKPQTMTGLVKGLEEAGLVERRVDTKDRRKTHLRATAKAFSLIDRARKNRLHAILDVLGDLDERERLTLDAAVDLLTRKLAGTPDATYRATARQGKRTRDGS